jgi:hypothetical protein
MWSSFLHTILLDPKWRSCTAETVGGPFPSLLGGLEVVVCGFNAFGVRQSENQSHTKLYARGKMLLTNVRTVL